MQLSPSPHRVAAQIPINSLQFPLGDDFSDELPAEPERLYPAGWSADAKTTISPVPLPVAARDRLAVLIRRASLRFRWVKTGDMALDDSAESVAIYAHFARSDRVSGMVLNQLRCYASLGFKIIFVTACKNLPKADVEKLKPLTSRIVCRRNFGLDFGAWYDVLATRMVPHNIKELLLLNDSVLGPIRPMEPILGRMRTAEGVWGLTNSMQWGAHLQSYFLLARGRSAIAEAFRFFGQLELSSQRGAVIERGELNFSKVMMKRGIPLYSMFGLSSIQRVLLDDVGSCREVTDSMNFSFHVNDLAEKQVIVRRELAQSPVNPTHQLAEILVERFGFPFLKTELIRFNPCKMSLAADWRRLIRKNQACDIDMIIEHLCMV